MTRQDDRVRSAFTPDELHALAASVAGRVLVPGEDGYDDERAGFELTVDHHPLVIVAASEAADVVAAVRFAAAHDLPVAVQATGHGASSPADGAVFVSTRRLTGTEIDPVARTATIPAGARWQEVIDAAHPHGLAPLSGSAPFVGAVSYTLGGGLGLMSRAYGLASDSVLAFDLVTADGRHLHVTPDSEPDLFWGVRGSKGNLGIVTSLQVRLHPVSQMVGGSLFLDGAHLRPTIEAWLDWVDSLDDLTSTSFFMVQFPADDQLPEPLRGRYVIQLRLGYVGSDLAVGRRHFDKLRDRLAAPLMDTVAELPYTRSGTIHNDPPAPVPTYSQTVRIRRPDPAAIDALIQYAGPEAAAPFGVEVRLLGGALDRDPALPAAARPPRGAWLNLYLASLVSDSAEVPSLHAAQLELIDALAPWAVPGCELNFLAGANTGLEVTRSAYQPADYQRLRELKTRWDPRNVFRFNPNIPPLAD